MMRGASGSGLITDLKTGLAFLTRLPLVNSVPAKGAYIGRAAWTFPLVGVLIGAFAALVYWLADEAGLPPLVSAVLAVAAALIVTGALHEDGLADTVDGFGGGTTKAQKLKIMRDSRIGTYGVLVLAVSLMLKASAIASLADPVLVAAALIAAHTSARAILPLFMRLVPPARKDGLSAKAGRPPLASVIIAGLLGLIALGLALGPIGALIALALLAAVAGFMAWLSMRQIGGQTGDVLGALEQMGEILILLAASAWL
jgi:adenosylcobinamide-GDP ribazoletransferase